MKTPNLYRIALIAFFPALGIAACGQSQVGPSGGQDVGDGASGATSSGGTGSGGGTSSGGAPLDAGTGTATADGVSGNKGNAGSGGAKDDSGGVPTPSDSGASTAALADASSEGGGSRSPDGGTDATTPGSDGAAGGADSGGSKAQDGSSPMADGGRADAGRDSGAGVSDGSVGGGDGGPAVVCPASSLAAGNSNRTVTVGTTKRTYVLHVPTAYSSGKPAPLVLDFHGLGGSGENEMTSSPYKAVTDPDGVISAYPDGLAGPSGTAWNLGPCCEPGVDDVAFAKALVQDVEQVTCIDPKRVYAVGFSIGGGMTHYIGCHAADVFAAISPAAADLLKENEDGCTPTRPITEITFRGTADPNVPYDGGAMTSSGMTLTSLGAVATFNKWASIDQCTGSPSAEDSSGCSTYSSCGAGVQVTLCTKQGGGHEPGNAAVSWPVLKKYTLP